MSQIKDQFGVIILVFVALTLLACLWVFRGEHDIALSIGTWEATVIGAMVNLVTGKPPGHPPTQQNRITNSTVSQVVEDNGAEQK